MRKSSFVKIGSTPESDCPAACDVIDTYEFDESLPDLARCYSSDDESVAFEADCDNKRCSDNASVWPGLSPPTVSTGERVSGVNKRQLRRENKNRRIEKQETQPETSYWSTHKGQFELPVPKQAPKKWVGEMCPRNLALYHPAAAKLLQYATGGCPANTGKPWSREEMQAAIDRGPHISAMDPDAMKQLATEVNEKVKKGQAKLVLWDDIKNDPPPELKISPIAMIPHKSRQFRAILDLSFRLKLKNGGFIPSVNESTTLEAPAGAIDQMGHVLSRVIHAMAEAGPEDKVCMAKFDIKDGFWRLNCAEGEEWNFSYVLPQDDGEPVRLVVPSSLQMGWVESPPNFCAASETARDVASQYTEMAIGSLPDHKFTKYVMNNEHVQALPATVDDNEFRYLEEVYVDDFLALAIALSQEQVLHVAQALLMGIHDVFPADEDDENDPISLKKLKKLEGEFALEKEMLGFDFNGIAKTMILNVNKRELLLATLHKWIRSAKRSRMGVPFAEFESVTSKLRHAFISVPAGKGLMTPYNKLLRLRPPVVYLHKNKPLLQVVNDCRDLMREATKDPTPCRELVMGETDFVGVKDASIHGVGGIVVGDKRECVPTVFRMEWPEDIKQKS
jgi:hypothetical protein